MSPLVISKAAILDYETSLHLIKNEFANNPGCLIGIYFENIKNIRIEALYLLKTYCKVSNKKIIIFDVPNDLRIYFYLENIILKVGCAFLNF